MTFNYRLGKFGFFAHPALTKEDPSGLLGNYQVLDQIAALKWVKRNIGRFGGDPDNITLFGKSSGGMSVTFLMTSPLGKGLFEKAIIKSGVPRFHDQDLEPGGSRRCRGGKEMGRGERRCGGLACGTG